MRKIMSRNKNISDAHSVTLSLDGEWDFIYQADPGAELRPPAPEAFVCRIPVPAYWDDHHDRLEKSEFWSRDCESNPFRSIPSSSWSVPTN